MNLSEKMPVYLAQRLYLSATGTGKATNTAYLVRGKFAVMSHSPTD